MKFNPDPNKQAQEVHSSNRTNKDNSVSITFNNSKVETILSQKHLELILDERLNFNEHLESKINKCYKSTGFLKRLFNKQPRDTLLRIYKFFVRSDLDYADTVYNKPNNEYFASNLDRVQCKACLAITGAIQGTPRERFYKELGLESLSDRRWLHKLTFFFTIMKGNSPQYLSNYMKGNNNSVYNTRSVSHISLNTFRTRTEKLKNSFFPFCISELDKLSNLTKQSENIKKFKIASMKDIKSNERSLYSIHDPEGVKLLSRLRLNFSH